MAPRNHEKTVLKNSLVDNFGRRYLWATDRSIHYLLLAKPSLFAGRQSPDEKEEEEEKEEKEKEAEQEQRHA